MLNGNPEFLELLSRVERGLEVPGIVEREAEAPDVRYLLTIEITDPTWRPKGPRTAPPGGVRLQTIGNARRVAILQNIERMRLAKPSTGWVGSWSIVVKKGSGQSVLSVPAQFRPSSPFDFPPRVEVSERSGPEFVEELIQRNARQFAESRRWTVVLKPLHVPPLDAADPLAERLSRVDAALFANWPAPTVPASREARTTPQANDSTSSRRRYQLGIVTPEGRIVASGETVSQTVALEILDRVDGGSACLVPVGR